MADRGGGDVDACDGDAAAGEGAGHEPRAAGDVRSDEPGPIPSHSRRRSVCRSIVSRRRLGQLVALVEMLAQHPLAERATARSTTSVPHARSGPRAAISAKGFAMIGH